MLFQPIVSLPSGEPEAYEALGRGIYPGLPEGPVELFDLAGALGPDVQRELSRLFRRRAVELVQDRRRPPLLFLNTHPADLETPGLVESLQELRAAAPALRLVLEIHESALGQIDIMSWLHGRLGEIDVRLAYDDFGAGQARLFELAEVPPEYLKFDRRFVDGIDDAPGVAPAPARARWSRPCASCRSRPSPRAWRRAEDAAACVRAGFMLAQGHHFGRPAPSSRSRAGRRARTRDPRLLQAELPRPQLPQAIAQLGGLLELEGLGRLAHLLLERLDLRLDLVDRAVARGGGSSSTSGTAT